MHLLQAQRNVCLCAMEQAMHEWGKLILKLLLLHASGCNGQPLTFLWKADVLPKACRGGVGRKKQEQQHNRCQTPTDAAATRFSDKAQKMSLLLRWSCYSCAVQDCLVPWLWYLIHKYVCIYNAGTGLLVLWCCGCCFRCRYITIPYPMQSAIT